MNSETTDRLMMEHCIGLSKASGRAGEYPYAAVICRDKVIVAEATNRVARDGDATCRGGVETRPHNDECRAHAPRRSAQSRAPIPAAQSVRPFYLFDHFGRRRT
jgi:tRNA(Arg) A34 adenosine deaminase TadA